MKMMMMSKFNKLKKKKLKMIQIKRRRKNMMKNMMKRKSMGRIMMTSRVTMMMSTAI